MVDLLEATIVAPLEATAVVPLDAVETELVSQTGSIQVTTHHLAATHVVHLDVPVQRQLLRVTTSLPEIITLLHKVLLTVVHLEVAVAAVAVVEEAEASVVVAAIVVVVIGNK